MNKKPQGLSPGFLVELKGVEPLSSFAVHCFLHVYPNVGFRNPVGDGLPAELLFRSYLGGTHGRYPLASDCNDTPWPEPYRKLRGIYAERSLAPSCRSSNHLVISMHKRKHKRSCCQLLFRYPGFTGPLPFARRAYNTHTTESKPKPAPLTYNYNLFEILPLERSYGDISTSTLSPSMILILNILIFPEMLQSISTPVSSSSTLNIALGRA